MQAAEGEPRPLPGAGEQSRQRCGWSDGRLHGVSVATQRSGGCPARRGRREQAEETHQLQVDQQPSSEDSIVSGPRFILTI